MCLYNCAYKKRVYKYVVFLNRDVSARPQLSKRFGTAGAGLGARTGTQTDAVETWAQIKVRPRSGIRAWG